MEDAIDAETERAQTTFPTRKLLIWSAGIAASIVAATCVIFATIETQNSRDSKNEVVTYIGQSGLDVSTTKPHAEPLKESDSMIGSVTPPDTGFVIADTTLSVTPAPVSDPSFQKPSTFGLDSFSGSIDLSDGEEVGEFTLNYIIRQQERVKAADESALGDHDSSRMEICRERLISIALRSISSRTLR